VTKQLSKSSATRIKTFTVRHGRNDATKLLSNRKPQLNTYQLACGYLQTRTNAEKHMCVTLWHESSHYHVRATYFDHPDMTGWVEWEGGIETVTHARLVFRHMVKRWLRN
jgi:hypothetical protein